MKVTTFPAIPAILGWFPSIPAKALIWQPEHSHRNMNAVQAWWISPKYFFTSHPISRISLSKTSPRCVRSKSAALRKAVPTWADTASPWKENGAFTELSTKAFLRSTWWKSSQIPERKKFEIKSYSVPFYVPFLKNTRSFETTTLWQMFFKFTKVLSSYGGVFDHQAALPRLCRKSSTCCLWLSKNLLRCLGVVLGCPRPTPNPWRWWWWWPWVSNGTTKKERMAIIQFREMAEALFAPKSLRLSEIVGFSHWSYPDHPDTALGGFFSIASRHATNDWFKLGKFCLFLSIFLSIYSLIYLFTYLSICLFLYFHLFNTD